MIAMIIPITTNTTIAICIQIQVGDIRAQHYRAVSTGLQALTSSEAGRLPRLCCRYA